MIIKRKKYLDQLLSKKDNGYVKIITGMRRVGKSFLLFELFYNELINLGIEPSQIIRINLEKEENYKYWNLDNLKKYIISNMTENKRYYVFIDEIQNVKSKKSEYTDDKVTFHHLLMSLMDKADVYVTGSNSKMLSSEIITEFRGRGDQIKVYPLTFKEFKQINESISNNEILNEYLLYGGLPWCSILKDEDRKNEYLKGVFDLIYIKDIIDKNRIKNKKEILDILIDILSSSVGSLTNPLKISNTLKSEYKISVSSQTIKQYIDYLIDSFILYEVKRYDVKGRKYINSPYKYYFSDLGLRNARLNFRQIDQQHIIENIIYNELIYQGYNVDVGVVESFTKNKNNKTERINTEIDFVANKGAERIYIQFALNILGTEKLEQEIRGFKNINDSFKKILIVGENTYSTLNDDGILVINIIDFLLDKWKH